MSGDVNTQSLWIIHQKFVPAWYCIFSVFTHIFVGTYLSHLWYIQSIAVLRCSKIMQWFLLGNYHSFDSWKFLVLKWMLFSQFLYYTQSQFLFSQPVYASFELQTCWFVRDLPLTAVSPEIIPGCIPPRKISCSIGHYSLNFVLSEVT